MTRPALYAGPQLEGGNVSHKEWKGDLYQLHEPSECAKAAIVQGKPNGSAFDGH